MKWQKTAQKNSARLVALFTVLDGSNPMIQKLYKSKNRPRGGKRFVWAEATITPWGGRLLFKCPVHWLQTVNATIGKSEDTNIHVSIPLTWQTD